MAQLSSVTLPATHRNGQPKQPQPLSDSEEEADLDQNPTDEQTMGAANSKETSIAEIVEETGDPPATSSRDGRDGSGQVSAEVSASTINRLALKRTVASSSALTKKTTFPESPPQSPGKRKRQPARDTPVSPSKRIVREHGCSEKDHGDTIVGGQKKLGNNQLVRPNRTLIGKSTNNRSRLPSTKDVFAPENISPANIKPVSRSRKIDEGQTKVRTGQRTAGPSSSVPIVGTDSEQGSPITSNALVDHGSDTNPGSPIRRVVTRISPKPKGGPKKPQQPAQSSIFDLRSTMSRNYTLRSINHSIEDKTRNLSNAPEHDPNAKRAVSTAKRARSSPKSSKTVATNAGAAKKVKPTRKVEAQIAERSSDDESHSLDGSGLSSVGGQVMSANRGGQRGSSESTVQYGHHDDDDGPEGDNLDENGETVGVEAEDDNDCSDRTEVDGQHQVKITARSLLRGPDWDKVMEGANTVGDSNNNNMTKKGKPQLETRTIKAFVKRVRKTSNMYKASGRRGEVEPEVQELARQVELIDEDKAGDKKCEMIQDIYAHAIPELVFMLDNALNAREADCSLPGDLKGLTEIIRLQNIVIDLCEKARDWKKGPITERPIKKSTTQKIFPYLRKMKQTLEKERFKRRRELLRRKDEAAAELERKRMEEEVRGEEVETERERLAIWENINEQLDRNERLLFPRKPPRPPVAIPPLGVDDWTEEQELVLHKYLEEFGDLPAGDRYLQMLTLPALQEKLPDHIRQRALYSRPNLENFYEKKQGWVPDWVLSIE